MQNTIKIPSSSEPGTLAWCHATGSTNRPEYLLDDFQVCEICSAPLFPIGSSGTCDFCLDWLADLGVYRGSLSWVRDLIKQP